MGKADGDKTVAEPSGAGASKKWCSAAKSGRPVRVRSAEALRGEIQMLSRLRTALMLDPDLGPSQQKKLDRMIEGLLSELVAVVRSREARAA